MKINSAFPSDYLKTSDLNGKAVRVQIADVTTEKVGDDQKPILHFVGKEKGLVLNKTNANRIVEATGTDETDEWAGWSIVLYPAKVDFQGKRVDAIRIDDRPGASKPPVTRATRPAAVVEDDIDIPSIDDEPIPF
jgi:hypothetical protein